MGALCTRTTRRSFPMPSWRYRSHGTLNASSRLIMDGRLTLVTEAAVAHRSSDSHHHRRRWLGGALGALAVVGVLALMAWCDLGEERAIREMPAAEREAFFTRTLQSFRSVCTAPADALRDHCAGQAHLLLEFPECDQACQGLASGWLSRAPR